MVDIRKRLPFQLSFRPTGATAGYADAYNSYDFAIGGVPFLSGFSPDSPFIRKSAEFKKTQVDQSPEPGEQSLTGWWVRSQSSWHGGAGLKFLEPSLDDSAPFRFDDAEGVDVWTPGQVTLLKTTTARPTAIAASVPFVITGARVGNSDVVAWANFTNSGMVVEGGTDVVFTYDVAPVTGFLAIASDGKNVYMASRDGIWRAILPAVPGAVVATKLWTYTGATNVSLGWVKGRLMAGIDTKIYELIPPASAAPYALPATAVYTSLVSDWRWSAITAGPEAIYASGLSGNRGSILKITVDGTGALPTLTGATEVAQLPTGEWPTVIRSYLGAFLVVGTNRGVRVAEVGTNGAIEYGALISTNGRPVHDLVSRDKFAYATFSGGFTGGTSGLLRIDLSMRHSSGRYAFAKDLQAPVISTARGVALIGNSDRIAVAFDDAGIYMEHATDLVSQGFLKLARIRYNTLWPKLFKRFNVKAKILGSVFVSTIDDTGAEISLVNLGENSDLEADLNISTPDRPQESLGMKFTLNRGTTTTGPLIRGYQIKSLPGGPRPHQFILPLQCYDYETGPTGAKAGYPGFSMERLAAIEALESSGEVVLLEHLEQDRQVLVTIEEYEFRQIAPQGHNQEHWGGILTLSLRTVSA